MCFMVIVNECMLDISSKSQSGILSPLLKTFTHTTLQQDSLTDNINSLEDK